MTPEEMRAEHPLISSSQNYPLILAEQERQMLVSKAIWPINAAATFIREYVNTFAEVLNPTGSDFLIGHGK